MRTRRASQQHLGVLVRRAGAPRVIGVLLSLAACPGGGAATTEGATETSTGETSSSTTTGGATTGEPTTGGPTTGPDTPTSGTSGTTGTTGTTDDPTSGTTGPDACVTVDDCEGAVCRPAVDCADGICVFEDMPEGTETPDQQAGDCARVVCDGRGGTQIEADASDAEDDGVDCTDDVCEDMTTVHVPQQMPCYTGPEGTADVGVCLSGVRTCDVELGEFGACEGEVLPGDEDCDAGHLDEDCDGEVDESGAACVCGDGIVSNDEPCDDGNESDADACTVACEAQAALQVACGSSHCCALLSGGRVKCWGAADQGQLGLGDEQARGDGAGEMGANLPPVALGAEESVVSVATGAVHSCALLTDGRVQCWGDGTYGALGLGDTETRGDDPDEMGPNLATVDLGTGKLAVALEVGVHSTCALLDDATLKCWGRNVTGALGLGDDENRGDGPGEMGDDLPAIDLGADLQATALAAPNTGQDLVCAILSDSAVKCWGHNGEGQLGLGDTTNRGDGPNEMGDLLPRLKLFSAAW